MTKDFTSEDILVAGWGSLLDNNNIYNSSTPTILQGLKQKVLDDSICRENYGNNINPENVFCVGGIIGYSICFGDSGGPLTWKGSFEADVSDRNYLLGVASFAPNPCGDSKIPSGFVRITFFMKSSVRLGEWNSSTDPDCQDGICAPPYQDIKVVEVIRHEFYTTDLNKDIALLRLESPANMSSFVRPVCLPYGAAMTKDFTSEDILVAGWGSLLDNNNIYNSSTPTILQGLKQKVLDDSICRENYGNNINPENVFCVGGIIGYSICFGDSGGPLTWKGSFEADVSDRNYLLGVASFAPNPCGDSKIPSGFVRITFFMKWILDHMRE
ncbi:hypothetical protein WDU94_005691 [Cyamophila willieti]